MDVSMMGLWKSMGLFAKGVVIVLAIMSMYSLTIMVSKWWALRQAQKESRKFVQATVREGSRAYQRVGVHLKGVGSFRTIEEKPSFTLKFNEYTSGQRFHGPRARPPDDLEGALHARRAA